MHPPFTRGNKMAFGRGSAPARTKLGKAFLEDLLAAYGEWGVAAIKEIAATKPLDFVKLVASLLPDQIEISDTSLNRLSDEELEIFIEYARRVAIPQISVRSIGEREDEAIN